MNCNSTVVAITAPAASSLFNPQWNYFLFTKEKIQLIFRSSIWHFKIKTQRKNLRVLAISMCRIGIRKSAFFINKVISNHKKTFLCKTAFPAQNDDNYSKETNLQTSRKNSSQRKTSRFQQNQKLELPGIDSICKPCLNAYFCRVGLLLFPLLYLCLCV